MEWKDIKIIKPDIDQQVLATDGENFHIAAWSKIFGLEHDNCDYSCRVRESLYWTSLHFQPERSKREDLPNKYNPNNYKSWCSCCLKWLYCSNCHSEHSNCERCK